MQINFSDTNQWVLESENQSINILRKPPPIFWFSNMLISFYLCLFIIAIVHLCDMDWREPDNFVIAALCFIKFNYWYGKRYIQYFSRYFSNQIQLNYIELLCFYKMFLKPVFIIHLPNCTCFYFITKIYAYSTKRGHSKPYKQLNSRSCSQTFMWWSYHMWINFRVE